MQTIIKTTAVPVLPYAHKQSPAPPSVVQNGPTPAAHVKKLARAARQLFDMGGWRSAILDHRWRRRAALTMISHPFELKPFVVVMQNKPVGSMSQCDWMCVVF